MLFVLAGQSIRDEFSYEVKKSELIEAVGELASASSLSLVRQFLASQEEG